MLPTLLPVLAALAGAVAADETSIVRAAKPKSKSFEEIAQRLYDLADRLHQISTTWHTVPREERALSLAVRRDDLIEMAEDLNAIDDSDRAGKLAELATTIDSLVIADRRPTSRPSGWRRPGSTVLDDVSGQLRAIAGPIESQARSERDDERYREKEKRRDRARTLEQLRDKVLATSEWVAFARNNVFNWNRIESRRMAADVGMKEVPHRLEQASEEAGRLGQEEIQEELHGLAEEASYVASLAERDEATFNEAADVLVSLILNSSIVQHDENDYRDRIRQGMAEAFFHLAWADAVEAAGLGRRLAGKNISDLAPPVHPIAFDHANELIRDLEAENDGIIENLFLSHVDDVGYDAETDILAESFGHYLAMEAMGHGVTWEDDHEPHGLEVPHIEGLMPDDIDFDPDEGF